ncbi:fumble-domain-containing protein [Limtongia smithiae]|uniref:fumble-domain-containing protein n=1 Tax=Limtongia smithiae TaxID=1125753 RepID=UPI0034CF74C6
MPSSPRRIPYPGSIRINVEGAFILDDEPVSSVSPGESQDSIVLPTNNANIHGTGSKTHNRDIVLPYHTSEVSHIAVDIGGSLAKVVYFSRDRDSVGGRINFIMFETENIDDLIAFMSQLISIKRRSIHETAPADKDENNKVYIMATGGGAYKFYERMRKELDVVIWREDEMECLIVGLDFFITEIPDEVFTYSEQNPMSFVEAKPNIYPYLLVNIGSGVSMIKVSGPRQFERIGGSSLGGGTLWGLLSLVTGAKSFDEMLDMASRGDNTNVDMLVGDIYGADYGRIGLKASTIASSFGKVFKKRLESNDGVQISDATGKNIDISPEHESSGIDDSNDGDIHPAKFRAEDISRSLLYAVSNNIGQIAYLQAQRYNLEDIYFGGSFIRGHPQTMNTLSYAIKFWSNGGKKAYFLRHEGYLGAVGAFLRRQPTGWGRRNSMDDPKRANVKRQP